MDTTANTSHEEEDIFGYLKDAQNALELIFHRNNTLIKKCLQCIDTTANQATSCDKHEGSWTKVAIQSYNLAYQTALKENSIYNRSVHHSINENKPCIETRGLEIKDDEQNTEKAQIIYQNTDMSATNIKEHEQKDINARKTEEKELKSDTSAEGISDYTLRSKHYADTTRHVMHEEEFRRLLITNYTTTLTLLNQYSSVGKCEGSSEEIYVTPTLHRLQRKRGWKEDGLTKVFTTCVAEENKTEINSYKDMFYTGHKRNTNIFLQGLATTGKSTFARKLVLDWCNDTESSSQYFGGQSFGDRQTLQMFKYVFLVLGDSCSQSTVTNLIWEQIVDKMYSEENRVQAYKLIQQIVETETCLVIQDGLPQRTSTTFTSKGNKAIPLMTGHNHCTVLITARPMRLFEERIKDSDIDCWLMLGGKNKIAQMVPTV